MKYNNVYMYDKINNNLIYCLQKVDYEVAIFIENDRHSRLTLDVKDLEEELANNNLVIGEPDRMKVLYGKKKD